MSNQEASDEAAKVLISAYKNAPINSEGEMEAIRALGKTGSAVAVEALRGIWKNSNCGSRRETEAIKALGEIGQKP